jgi:hypothetical protein
MAVAGTTLLAVADDDDHRGGHGRGGIKVVKDPVVIKECGPCHMVFQPGFLPAASWKKMMGDLENHFGDNAKLDPAIAKTITDYLVANAADARGRRGSPVPPGAEPPLRITELRWFKHEHRGRRGSPETLKRRKAKSLADCKACHPGAERGYYDDD